MGRSCFDSWWLSSYLASSVFATFYLLVVSPTASPPPSCFAFFFWRISEGSSSAYLVWMSDRDRLHILERRLLEFAQDFDELATLATALSARASLCSEVAYEIAFADWDTVAEPQDPPGVPNPSVRYIPICAADRSPPDFPKALGSLATEHISSTSPGPVARAARAFEMGFWARTGLETRRTITPLGRALPVTDEHWIFWTTIRFGQLRPVRFTCQEDAQRLSDLFPCDRSNHNQATFLVGFPTLFELQCFCIGARMVVPALWKYRPRVQSHSSAVQNPGSVENLLEAGHHSSSFDTFVLPIASRASSRLLGLY